MEERNRQQGTLICWTLELVIDAELRGKRERRAQNLHLMISGPKNFNLPLLMRAVLVTFKLTVDYSLSR